LSGNIRVGMAAGSGVEKPDGVASHGASLAGTAGILQVKLVMKAFEDWRLAIGLCPSVFAGTAKTKARSVRVVTTAERAVLFP